MALTPYFPSTIRGKWATGGEARICNRQGLTGCVQYRERAEVRRDLYAKGEGIYPSPGSVGYVEPGSTTQKHRSAGVGQRPQSAPPSRDRSV